MAGMNRATQLRLDRLLPLEQAAMEAKVSPKSLRMVVRGELVQPRTLACLSSFYGVKATDLYAPATIETSQEAA